MINAVRGAIGVHENSEQAIGNAVNKLMQSLLEKNNIKRKNIVSVVFSVTGDLTAANPAAMLRRRGSYADTPLFAVQEAACDGSPPQIIRVLLQARGFKKKTGKAVYLDGAEKLRPDLIDN